MAVGPEFANMDESIVTFGIQGILSSSVLIPMGIRINKPNQEMRIRQEIDKFNETYLETMDFLTQILPLAREQFGRSDNVLLPKTPAKKRLRKAGRGLVRDQENANPNISLQEPEEAPPVKRTTRSSNRKNPPEIREEPVRTKKTRGRKKKSCNESKVEQSVPIVALVDEKKTAIIIDEVTPLRESPKNLKRCSSMSPVSVKPVKKKSKSCGNESLVEEDTEKQTSTPIGSQSLSVLEQPSVSLIVVEPETKSSNSELVLGVVENKVFSESLEDANVEKMDVECSDKNEAHTTSVLVEIGDGGKCNKVERPEVVLVLDTPPCNRPASKVPIEPETSILVNINEKGCEFPDEPVPATSEVVDEWSFHSANGNTEVQPMVDEVTDSTTVTDKVKQAIPTEVQSLRRSKRLSKQISKEQVLQSLTEQAKEKSPKQVDEPQQEFVEEPISDNQDETPEEQLVSKTPEVRAARRSSRRVSRVSTGLRRSCRRSIRRSGANFKKPMTLKRIEVTLGDIGTNKVVVSESSSKALEEQKAVSSNSEQSSTESEDDGAICNQNDGLKKSSKVFTSLIQSLSTSSKTDSSNEEVAVPLEGKVAGLVQQINTNNLREEQSSMCKTPNQVRKIKRLGSSVQGSSVKLSNLVGGNIRSFIKPRQSVKKLDPNELLRQKRLELQRKEEKDQERKTVAELSRKNFAEEQKRKREEKQKRVTEKKAERERIEQDKKQRQLQEKKHMLLSLEQAKKKREHEEETKKRQREQRMKEAEARRLREKEERLKRLHEKEEEENMYRDMFKRKQEHDEQERKQRIQDEKRLHEQKQRERQREKEEERERRLREIKERDAKRAEKEEIERKQKDEAERKEIEDKERKRRELEERERKRIAQLIRDKMEQERKLHEEKRQKEEKERREREEQRKREANRINLQAKTADSYLMTPPPAQTRKPSTSENYDIDDIRSDESTDDEDCPRKKVPDWAKGIHLRSALSRQEEPRRIFEDLSSGFVPHAPDLEKIFTKKRKRFYQRTSSAHWATPPIKA